MKQMESGSNAKVNSTNNVDGKKAWHVPVATTLEFDATALTTPGTPGDAGCCCCSYTAS